LKAELRAARPFLAWPGLSHLGYGVLLGAANGLWFMLVFGGADYLTAQRALRLHVHFDWELGIPLVPAMTAFYMSLYLLFGAAPFILRTRAEVRALVASLSITIGIAGIFFLLVPAVLAYPPVAPAALGPWQDLFAVADQLNLTYNLVPSLHVALAVCCIAVFAQQAPGWLKLVLWAWAIGIALSTLLTHQHHVIDMLAGWLLALLVVKAGYRKMASPALLRAAPV